MPDDEVPQMPNPPPVLSDRWIRERLPESPLGNPANVAAVVLTGNTEGQSTADANLGSAIRVPGEWLGNLTANVLGLSPPSPPPIRPNNRRR
jgi:hypothetical protein